MPDPTAANAVQEAMRLIQAGAPDDAEALCRKTLAGVGDHPDLLHALGLALAQRQDFAAAAAAIERSVDLHGANADANYNLGVILEKLGRLEDAVGAWRRAADLAPAHAAVSANLGLALTRMARYEDAFAVYDAALSHHPDNADFLFWAGNALTGLERGPEARPYYQKAVALRDDFVEAWHFLGMTARDDGDVEAAIRCQEKTITLRPDFADAHFELAQALLLSGDFTRGFDEYQWRWRRPRTPPRSFSQPPLGDAEAAGRSILLYGEQGVGDTLQFVRYAPLLAAEGARVTVSCHESLLRLFAGTEAVDRVAPLFGEPEDFDGHAPLMDLPRRFATTVDTVPARVPYIPVPPAPAIEGLDGAGAKTRVGIVWSGNPQQPNNRNRACPLELMARLAAVEGTAFFSLQVGDPANHLAGLDPSVDIVDLAPRLGDFHDTAAVIGRLDLVITVDTAVAHLAGALARPVWLLLSHVADWRWLLGRADSPWYPTMRIFRQDRPGDWPPVIARVADALKSRIGL
jgi:tetratricopeptide (TPR) repeat protein